MPEQRIMLIPMNNFSLGERIFMAAKGLAALAILLLALISSPVPFFTYFISGILVILALVAAWSWLKRVSYSEMDFDGRKVRRYFSLNPFSKHDEADLQRFETVISTWNFSPSGPNWIAVSLSGRTGSLELARFGSFNNFSTHGGHALDEPRAKALREQLSARLNLRDLGVV
uniref:DUF2244 domain-containing protein n=1 Tax=Dechloromonas aromatica (strain RCB) TaxID=159087 RepID=Q47F54_DECAR